MEDLNPFPRIEITPKLNKAARFIAGLFRSPSAPLHMSNHYNAEHFTGAAAMLDEALYQPELAFTDTPHAVSEGWLPYDSEGCYLDPNEL